MYVCVCVDIPTVKYPAGEYFVLFDAVSSSSSNPNVYQRSSAAMLLSLAESVNDCHGYGDNDKEE